MQCTFPRREFQKAFGLVSQVVPARSPKEILQNAKLLVREDGTASLSGTDLETFISVDLPRPTITGSGGAELLPIQKFGSILRESTAEEIAIESHNEHGIIVRADRSRYTLRSADVIEYPSVTEGDTEKYFEINAAALRAAIKRTIYAADTENSRYTLGAINIDAGPGASDLNVVATDGRRMSWMAIAGQRVGINDVDQIPAALVPVRAAKVIDSLLEGADLAQLRISANSLSLRTEHCVLSTRLLDGRFPSWQQVVPDESAEITPTNPIRVSFAAGVLGAAIRQAAITTDMESRGLTLSFSPGTLSIHSELTELGESEITLPAAYEGRSIAVRLDHRYLSDICRCMDAEAELHLTVYGESNPVVFRTDDGFTGVIMPMAKD